MIRSDTSKLEAVGEILDRAKRSAIDYYQLTGKPLGITGEYGEYVAAATLGLTLAEARTAGYDAIDSTGRRIQIKARSIPREKKLVGQRLGSIRLDHEWDVVLLVVMDELFDRIIEIARTGISILMVEQNARQALEIAHKGYVLVQGANRFTDTGQALLADPEVRRSFLGG